MTVQAVFFDAAGTLFKPARRVGESYAVIAAKHGMNVSAADVNERFRICFDTAPRLAFPGARAGELAALERGWWKSLVADVFRPWEGFGDFDAYFDELFAYFADPRAWILYPEVLHTLSALKERGVVLDVISNFDSRLIGILEGLGAATWFEQIFISSCVGYAKPDRRIFEAALNEHRLSAASALHVGDSEINDLHGANNAGLKGILVDRSSGASSRAQERVASLDEILSLLDD
jgi:putative hydrolase of the HAD superfamily